MADVVEREFYFLNQMDLSVKKVVCRQAADTPNKDNWQIPGEGYGTVGDAIFTTIEELVPKAQTLFGYKQANFQKVKENLDRLVIANGL